ncbi:MAG: O-methyltransferase [Rhodospirillales bacterium]
MARDAVLRDIEAAAARRRWPIVGPEKGRLLADMVRAAQPARILEVGTLVCYSAILMNAAQPAGGTIDCVEISSANAALARAHFERAGIAGRIAVHVGPGAATIPTLAGPFDLLFIDAAKAEYLDYLRAAEPLLAPDAVVVADNVGVFRDAVAPYLHHVRTGGRYETVVHDFGWDAVAVSRRQP